NIFAKFDSPNGEDRRACLPAFQIFSKNKNFFKIFLSTIFLFFRKIFEDDVFVSKEEILEILISLQQTNPNNFPLIVLETGGFLILLEKMARSPDQNKKFARKLQFFLTKLAARNNKNSAELKKALFLLLPKSFERVLETTNGAHSFFEMFWGDFEAPDFFWNENCRKELRDFLESEVDLLKERIYSNEKPKKKDFDLKAFAQRAKKRKNLLNSKLSVNGIYVDPFNRNPDFRIENPKELILKTIEAIKSENRFYKFVERKKTENGTKNKMAHAKKNLGKLWQFLKFVIGQSDEKIWRTPLEQCSTIIFENLQNMIFPEDFDFIENLIFLVDKLAYFENSKINKRQICSLLSFAYTPNFDVQILSKILTIARKCQSQSKNRNQFLNSTAILFINLVILNSQNIVFCQNNSYKK
ncbi:hypothetical protein MHBO_001658, partial [Bonamia ostreae]